MNDQIDRASRLQALRLYCTVIQDEVAGLLEVSEDINAGNDVLHLEFMRVDALAELFREAGDLPEPSPAERRQAGLMARAFVHLIKSHKAA